MNINPPYTYNDYRYTYNQECFYYNGGFDLECLSATLPRRGGSKHAKQRKKVYPQTQIIELLFKTDLYYINDEKYNNDYVIKRYNFKEVKDVKMLITEMKLKQDKYILTSECFSPQIIKEKLNVNAELLKEYRIKYDVQSCFWFKKPLKIKVGNTIFKQGKTKGNKNNGF